jgi:hypothetical protein
MRPSLPLRLASALAFIQSVAHTALLLSYVPTHGPAEASVVEAMKRHRFDFGGFSDHSYWDMYIGYGLFAAINCLIEAVLFWQLASLTRNDPTRARPLMALFFFANLGYAAMVWRYFFAIPLIFDLAIALCLAAALAAARPAASLLPRSST